MDEQTYRQARVRDDELNHVPRELLDWSQDLPDGTQFTRPEKDQILQTIGEQDTSTQVLLGPPGSGKSALLAEVANALAADGVRVLPTKPTPPQTILPMMGEMKNISTLKGTRRQTKTTRSASSPFFGVWDQ